MATTAPVVGKGVWNDVARRLLSQLGMGDGLSLAPVRLGWALPEDRPCMVVGEEVAVERGTGKEVREALYRLREDRFMRSRHAVLWLARDVGGQVAVGTSIILPHRHARRWEGKKIVVPIDPVKE